MGEYKYTIGGALVGAIAGAALTKLMEDEEKKSDLKDYLLGSGIGLGLGALGGRVLDTSTPEDKLAALRETIEKDVKPQVESDLKKINYGRAVGLPAAIGGGIAVGGALGSAALRKMDAANQRRLIINAGKTVPAGFQPVHTPLSRMSKGAGVLGAMYAIGGPLWGWAQASGLKDRLTTRAERLLSIDDN